MTRYNWDAIPNEYKWVAMDAYGYVLAFKNEPELHCWGWGKDNEPRLLCAGGDYILLGDWRDSLEERPKPAERYRLDPNRWVDSGIKDTTTNRYLTLGEVLDRLNGEVEL